MAVNVRRIAATTIQQARFRGFALSRYLRLSGPWPLLLTLFALTCIMALAVLFQTGRVATLGFTAQDLRARQVVLMREHGQLQARKAEAQHLETVRSRAFELGLRPIERAQMIYLVVDPNTQQVTPIRPFTPEQ